MCYIFSTSLCLSVYVFPACNLNTATMCLTVSRAPLHISPLVESYLYGSNVKGLLSSCSSGLPSVANDRISWSQSLPLSAIDAYIAWRGLYRFYSSSSLLYIFCCLRHSHSSSSPIPIFLMYSEMFWIHQEYVLALTTGSWHWHSLILTILLFMAGGVSWCWTLDGTISALRSLFVLMLLAFQLLWPFYYLSQYLFWHWKHWWYGSYSYNGKGSSALVRFNWALFI